MAKVSKRQVREVAKVCAATLGVAVEDLFIAGHAHEGLAPGAYSIAFEGAYDWPQQVSVRQFEPGVLPEGVFVEPINGWALAVYPGES